MTLDETIKFVTHVHRAELAEAQRIDSKLYAAKRSFGIAQGSRKPTLKGRSAIELKNALSQWDLNFPHRTVQNTWFYIKAIRVTLVESGWDDQWVESVVRTLLDANYLDTRKMSAEAAKAYAGSFYYYYPSEEDKKTIQLLITARFNVHKYFQKKKEKEKKQNEHYNEQHHHP